MATVRKDKVQVEVEINGKKSNGKTLADLNSRYKQLNREIRNLAIGSEEYQKKLKELQSVRGQLDAQRRQMRGISNAQRDAAESSTVLGKSFKKLGGTIKTAFTATGILALINLVVEGAREIATLVTDFQGLREEANRLSGETGQNLSDLVANAKALERTFGIAGETILESTNAASKAFGEDFPTVIGAIEKGLLLVQGQGDELLQQVKEYSVQFKQAGFDAEESVAIIANAINQGVFNDYGADAIKEFTLRITQLSASQRETLEESFGKGFAQRIEKGVQTGEISVKEALASVSTELGKFDARSAQTQKVVSELFGGPGENAGTGFILSLQNADKSLDDLIQTGNVYVDRQLEQLQLEKELAAAQEELAFQFDGTGSALGKFATQLKTNLFVALNNILEFIQYLPSQLKVLTSSWQSFANAGINAMQLFFETIVPIIPVLEAFTGKTFDLPTFTVPQATLDAEQELQDKIAADREKFAEAQALKTLAAQQKEEEAKRLLQAREAAKTRKQREKELADLAKLEADAQRKIEDLLLVVMQEGADKQIAQLRLQAQRELAALKGSAEQQATQRKLIEQRLANAIIAIREKEAKRLLTEEEKQAELAYQAKLADLDSYHAERQLAIAEQTAAEIQLGGGIEAAEKEMQERLLTQLKSYLLEKRALQQEEGLDTSDVDGELAALELDAAKQQAQNQKDIADKKKEDLLKVAESTSQALGFLFQAQAIAAQNAYNEEVEGLEKAKERELAIAGDNAEERKAIEEKFAIQREKIDAAYRKKQKEAAIKQAVIDGALAVVKAIASSGFPENLAGIAFAVATTAAQVATISSQEFERGGIAPGIGGVATGARHRQGGIKMVDSRSGQLVGEMEGGEPILSRATYANNRGIVDQLLYSGRHMGGAAIFEEGGVLSAPGTTPSQDTIELAQQIDMSGIETRLEILIGAVRQIRLQIGEEEAAAIGDIQTEYTTRLSRTSL